MNRSPYAPPIMEAINDIGMYFKPTYLFIGTKHAWDIKKLLILPIIKLDE